MLFTPMPSAIAATAASVNPGLFARIRQPNRMSGRMLIFPVRRWEALHENAARQAQIRPAKRMVAAVPVSLRPLRALGALDPLRAIRLSTRVTRRRALAAPQIQTQSSALRFARAANARRCRVRRARIGASRSGSTDPSAASRRSSSYPRRRCGWRARNRCPRRLGGGRTHDAPMGSGARTSLSAPQPIRSRSGPTTAWAVTKGTSAGEAPCPTGGRARGRRSCPAPNH